MRSPPYVQTQITENRKERAAVGDLFRQQIHVLGPIFARSCVRMARPGAQRAKALVLLKKVLRAVSEPPAYSSPRSTAPRRLAVRRHRRATKRAQKTGTDDGSSPEPPPPQLALTAASAASALGFVVGGVAALVMP